MAGVTASGFDVLNPLTPLAYLEPEIARQVTYGTFLHVGILAVIIWDALHNLRNDYILAAKHRIGVPTVAYFLSRLAVLVYALARAVVLTTPVGDCRRLELATNAFLAVCLCLNTFLFLIRVCAVYYNKLYIVVFFGLFWLVTIGMACLVPPAMTATHVEPTKYCIEVVKTYSLIPTYFVFIAYDTSIFLATSFRFYQLFTMDNSSISTGLQIAFLGASMPAFSRAMLHESQLYYMAVPLVKLGIVIGALVLKADPPGLVIVAHLVPVHVMLASVITCRVFRNTKLGLIAEPINCETLPLTNNSLRMAPVQSSGCSGISDSDGIREPYDSSYSELSRSNSRADK